MMGAVMMVVATIHLEAEGTTQVVEEMMPPRATTHLGVVTTLVAEMLEEMRPVGTLVVETPTPLVEAEMPQEVGETQTHLLEEMPQEVEMLQQVVTRQLANQHPQMQ